jgi:hypothetical protein
MIENLFLTYYSYFEGGPIGNMLSQWEQMGFFSYVLPFLLIFALVFGILSRLKLFSTGDKTKPNNAINAILSFVIALMSLQFNFVPQFFSEVFPRLGVGLAVILIVIILLGFFMPQKVWGDYVFLGIGGIILLIILNKSFGFLNWTAGNLSYQTVTLIVYLIIILIVIGVIVGTSKPKNDAPSSKIMRLLNEDD